MGVALRFLEFFSTWKQLKELGVLDFSVCTCSRDSWYEVAAETQDLAAWAMCQ